MPANEKKVIASLKGWLIESEELSETTRDRAVKVIKKKYITKYIEKAVKRAKGYTNNQNLDTENNEIVVEAVETWTAGLLWNRELRDQSVPDPGDKVIQTGDALIAEAKEMLSPNVIPVNNTLKSPINRLVIGTAFISDD
ncbi:hypothetical protein MBCUT_06810 [Methanobrevibacter cuticularis]|uniref:Uncharacterized protein n=1 Tax=Methanobrevibacter cuticularis TaxID=47311 RepID=A0A166EGX8_9EURY|nr:hypothetical protein [Methanobrevibacter cuticularis]KZX16643.1 hypothetical protein MBCUT_06810 [Methanobrevibacter cuticularis]